MPAASDRSRLAAAAREFMARAEDDPPPGFVGHDRDGAMVTFGPDPVWLPSHEGQVPTVIPAPTNFSGVDPAVCETCGADLGGKTCMSCFASGVDHRLNAEIVADAAKAKAKDARLKPRPRSLAERRYGAEAKPA